VIFIGAVIGIYTLKWYGVWMERLHRK